MNSNITYDYNYGLATYIINYKGQQFIGQASCHPEDMDMESDRVGLTIAEARATIKLHRFIRDFEIKPQLKILRHLYSNIKNNKRYNPKNRETKMMYNQIRALEKELVVINNDIADEKKFLKDYIDGKDKLYKRLRAKHQ